MSNQVLFGVLGPGEALSSNKQMSVTKLGAKVIHTIRHRYQESSVSDECRVCGKGETDRIHVDNRGKE